MIDERERFERAFELFGTPQTSFDRLLRLRDRKQRNRRIKTVVIALLLTIAATGGLVQAFRDLGATTPASGPVVTSIPVGNWSDIASVDGAIWVVTGDGSLLRIDTGTDQVTATISLAGGSQDRSIAVDADAVWVANGDDGTVQQIDPATDRISAIVDLGGATVSIATGSGSVWVAQYMDGESRLIRLDPDTNQVVATIPLDIDPDFISVVAGDDAIWVGTQASVDRIDPATKDVSRVYDTAFGSAVGDFTFADGALWGMACEEWGAPDYESRPNYVAHLYESHPMCASSILHLDARSGNSSTVPIGSPHPKTSPDGITTLVALRTALLAVDGEHAWVFEADLEGVELGTDPPCGWCVTEDSRAVNQRVLEIDLATGRTLATIPLAGYEPPGPGPYGIVDTRASGDLGAGDLWVLTRSGSLIRIDLGTR